MAAEVWRGAVAGSGRNRNGTPRTYSVTINDDGTGTCTCVDWIIRSRNAGVPERPCKHIRQQAAQLRRRLPGLPARRAPLPPTPADTGIWLGSNLTWSGTILPAPTPVQPTAPAPSPPAPTDAPPAAPEVPAADRLGLTAADITRKARRGNR